MVDKSNVLGVLIDKINMRQAVDRFFELIKNPQPGIVFTPNAEIVYAAKKDGELCKILNSADMCVADGAGVVLASKMLRDSVPERVAGFDLVMNAMKRAAKTGTTVYLLGGKLGVADAAKNKLEQDFAGIDIVGTHDGYFANDSEVVQDINVHKPDILLVCLGAPRQERWIYDNAHALNIGVCIGAGGALDVIAGNVMRAPLFYQKHGLEWLYRLAKQPSRIGRMMALPKFLFCAAVEKRTKCSVHRV